MVFVAILNLVAALTAVWVSALFYINAKTGAPRIESRGSIGVGALAVKRDSPGLIESIGTDPDYVLYLLQLVARYELGFAREALARELALRESDAGKPSIEGLVGAWKAEPELTAFADAVAAAMNANEGQI